MRTRTGFTVIELMVTIAVTAALLVLVVPAFGQFVLNRSITSQANSFATMLAFARSEAVKRNSTVSMCKSANGVTCRPQGNWAQGFIVFVDSMTAGTLGVVDPGEQVLRVVGQVHDSLSLGGVPTQGPAGPGTVSHVVTFRSDGLSNQTGRWTVCSNVADSDFAIRIVMQAGSGRAEMTKSFNNQWCG